MFTEDVKKAYVSNKNETPRMFQNNFLEMLTKVHPATPLVIFIPVIGYMFFYSRLSYEHQPLRIIIHFLSGLAFWTFFEYSLHRTVFHFIGTSQISKKIHFLIHGIHHDYPRDPWRLVMPPTVSIVLSFLIYKIMQTLMPQSFLYGFFAGFMLGYLVYDMSHYAIHHFQFKNKWFLLVRSHHYRHHYDDAKKNFGVSSPLWDYVFKTIYRK
jgi:sterol desaturase/sphingolipid hydroxylase (fatty acid hydroxylase superfamily)